MRQYKGAVRGLLCWGLVLGCWLPAAASYALAELDLFGKAAPPPFVAPGNLFSLQIPKGWQAVPLKNSPNVFEFRSTAPHVTAWLQVAYSQVPAGAKPEQMMLLGRDKRLRKLPHFQEVEAKTRILNGLPAAVITGQYWYQGNVQFPRAVEEVYLVAGTDGYTLHFECFADKAEQLSGEVDVLYNSFIPRPDKGLNLGPPPAGNPLENLPF